MLYEHLLPPEAEGGTRTACQRRQQGCGGSEQWPPAGSHGDIGGEGGPSGDRPQMAEAVSAVRGWQPPTDATSNTSSRCEQGGEQQLPASTTGSGQSWGVHVHQRAPTTCRQWNIATLSYGGT